MAAQFWAVSQATRPTWRVKGGSEAAGYAAGLLTWLLAGSVFVAVKLVSDEMPPWTMCFFRALIAALVLLPFVASHHSDMMELLRRRWKEAVFIGALGLGLTQGVMFTALHHASAVSVGIVFALCPMITMVMARFVLGERMNGWQALGTLIAFSGIVVTAVHASLARLLALDFGAGDLIALGAGLMFASYTVLLKRAKFELPPMPTLTILLFGGSLGAFPFFLLEYFGGEHADLATNGYLALIYCSTIGGVAMYFLYNLSVGILGASRAGTLVYTQMFFVALFAWLLLGEPIEWYHVAGAALVVVGVLFVTLLRPKPAAA